MLDSPSTIRAALDELLAGVAKPGRYLGLERNRIVKEWDSVAVRVLLAFPDEYGIGMSHTGTRILYHLANARPDTLCERAFAPWPDMAEAMRNAGLPLYSLESYHPARAFDVVGITLQSELNYINIPYLLDLAGIPRFADRRGEHHPLVVGGGPCTANPEPVADFFDVLAIGDGEVLLPTLIQVVNIAKAADWPRKELLRALARSEGLYVPQLYRWVPEASPAQGGRFEILDDAAPATVKRQFVETLQADAVPDRPLVPAVDVVQDRLGMEVMRGCTQGCRFCQAGFWYRPVREHEPATVLNALEAHVEATGYEEVSLLSLSSSDYSQIAPLTRLLAARLAPQQVGVALPSLRAETFSVALADEVSRVRRSGFTFAPETGSERLRRVLNKRFSNASMIEAAEAAYSRGWNLIKLYAMVGLPSETEEDLLELPALARDLLQAARRVGSRHGQVKVSVGPFVPKSWTPFQWEPFLPTSQLEERIDLLRRELRTVRGAKLTWSDPRLARLEALLARGDRRLAQVIARAHDLGAVFDGWSEWLDLEAWEQAIRESGLDIEAELGRRNRDATLPWDIIDAGVRKSFLKAEHRRAFLQAETRDCRWGPCYRCGIPGDGQDIRLATGTVPAPAQSQVERVPGTGNRRSPTDRHPTQQAVSRPTTQPLRYRFTFSKLGDVRWLSHRNVMSLLERALRAASVPVRFTQGYNPHIRLSMGPALPVGYEAKEEHFDTLCETPVSQAMLDRANALLPEGLRLDAAELVPEGTPSLGKACVEGRYRVQPRPGQPVWSADRLALLRDGGALACHLDGVDLVVTVPLGRGTPPTLKALLLALGLDDGALAGMRILREALIFDR